MVNANLFLRPIIRNSQFKLFFSNLQIKKDNFKQKPSIPINYSKPPFFCALNEFVMLQIGVYVTIGAFHTNHNV